MVVINLQLTDIYKKMILLNMALQLVCNNAVMSVTLVFMALASLQNHHIALDAMLGLDAVRDGLMH